MTRKWWKEAIVYQIYCKSFCDSNGDGIGDLPGVLSRLPLLEDLGITCIWFNPLYRSPQVDNGYDISDFQDMDPAYGTLDDFKRILEETHRRGIRVVMDLVLNHSSDEHRWFQESRKSRDNPYRHYYVWRPPRNGKEPNNWGNYFYEGRGSAWEFDETTGEYYLHQYSRKMPDLNWEYAPLRAEMYAMMRWWLDMGVSGFRLDAINRLKKPEGLPDSPRPPTPPVGIHGYVVDREHCANVPGIHALLKEINREVFSRYDIMTVGETGSLTANHPPGKTAAECALPYICEDSHELNMVFHFEIGKNKVQLTPREYKETQQRWIDLIRQNAWITQYLSNHDTPRQVSWFGDENEYRVESAKMLALLTHTMPGTPFVYQGEEIGMTNVYFENVDDYNECYLIGKYHTMVESGVDPREALGRLQKTSRDNARTPYPWTGEKHAGFTTGTPWMRVNPNYPSINLEKDRASPDSIFAFYRELHALRKKYDAMVYGAFRYVLLTHPQMVLFTRTGPAETLLTVTNFSASPAPVEFPDEITREPWDRILTSRPDESPSLNRKEWRPYEAELYVQKR